MIGKRLILSGLFVLVILTISSTAQQPDGPLVVNIMVDAEFAPHYQNMTLADRERIELASLKEMLNELDSRGLNATIYPTGEFVTGGTGSAEYRDYLAGECTKPNYEMASHSMASADMLGGMPYDKQYSLLARSKKLIESAYFKEGIPMEAKGFRPQYFNQSEFTYRALDAMGTVYDSGFKAGILFIPGHQNDTWPYPVDGHSFYAVPVSSHMLDGDMVYMCDLSAKYVETLNGTQWLNLLTATLDDCASKGDPMVVIFHNFVCGNNDGYMMAYKEFINRSISKNAAFVTTLELVEMAKKKDNP